MASNDPRPTKAERREAARAQAQAMREEQERRERRAKITRRSLLGVGALVVVGGGSAAFVLNRRKSSGSGSTTSLGALAQGRANRKGVPDLVLSDGSWTYGAGPKIDSVNSGAQVLHVYFDYSCHYCALFETLHSEEITQLLNDKQITLALHPCKILGQQWTDMVMNAMGLVLDEQPEAAMDLHKQVFAFFTKIFDSQDASLMTVENIVSTALSSGVSEEVSAKLKDTITDNTYGDWTELGSKTFADKGFTGTPTVILDGRTLDLSKVGTATGLTELISGASASAEATPAPAPAG